LGRRPVENNVLLSLLHDRVARCTPGRYWTVARAGEVVGFALQSPLEYSGVLSSMDREAAGALAAAMAADPSVHLPGIMAEAATAADFAGWWSERSGGRAVPDEGQRIYRLGVLRPVTGVPGRLRRAATEDSNLLVGWRHGFIADTGHGLDPVASVQRDLEDGRLFFWDDDGPCCTARASRPVAGVGRVGLVYTPPERRRRGYASACVGAVSAWLREQEQADSMLYTQLANPTSNSVYRRLGYGAVAEVLSYTLEPPARLTAP